MEPNLQNFPNYKVRMPAQNIDAEMSVLGSLMLDNNAIIKISDILKPESFYKNSHGTIYKTMLELFEKNEPIDILSVSSKLREKNLMETAGGLSYLTDLVNGVPSASNISYYAEIVRNKEVLRKLLEASSFLSELSYKEDDDINNVIDDAEKKIFEISKNAVKQKFVKVKDVLEEAWERIDNLHKSPEKLRGVPSGFKTLDNILLGFQNSDLVILAARPSLGKTALALNIAKNAAVNYDIPVGIFSLEMPTRQIIDRLLASESSLDLWKIRTGRLNTQNGDFDKLSESLEKLSKAPIFIDDEASNTILQIRTMARRLRLEHNLGMLIVDYLQLIKPRNANESPVQQVTEISRSLKQLAKELDIPIIALSQLSRAVEQRPNARPRLSDLRDSGSIEQDADVVMFIHREDRYKQQEDHPRKNQADILIEKHRNGQLGKSTLYFYPEKQIFMDMEKDGNQKDGGHKKDLDEEYFEEYTEGFEV